MGLKRDMAGYLVESREAARNGNRRFFLVKPFPNKNISVNALDHIYNRAIHFAEDGMGLDEPLDIDFRP